MPRLPLATLLSLLCAGPALADKVQVAVAANFTAPMKEIAVAFERSSGHKALLSFGATGQFHAQIHNGAPFEVLLAADSRTPQKLEEEGSAVAGSRFTYAEGQLVLWSADPALIDASAQVLKSGQFRHLAIANPKTAPYGSAALETLQALGVRDSLQGRLVQSENIAQCYQFIATGNAALGFVAKSQVFLDGKLTSGSSWEVPASLHSPILQDAVLLNQGKDNAAATALLAYLQSDEARAVIRRYGYRTE